MRFLDSFAFSLITLWGLRIVGLSALTDSWPEGTFDDTFFSDISFVTVPEVKDDDLFGEKANVDDLASVIQNSDEGLIMNENEDLSSCGVFSADDSTQGEFLIFVYDCFLRTRDSC